MSADNSWSYATDGFHGEPSPGERPADRGRPALRSGDRFGRFEILDQLGRGGVGTVYAARDPTADRRVALKIIPHSLGDRQRERFAREGELTAALRHPNVVAIHASGEVEGVPYLAYELVEGGRTLKDALGEVGRAELLGLLRDVARGLGHAHRQGIVHRDVKPANILIDGEGRPRLADFGLALQDAQSRLTRTREMVGTPCAMAPEQMETGRRPVTPATDVWALGVVLYQGLAGAPPFPGRSLIELCAQMATGRVRSPRDHDPSIPPPLEAICLKCLQSRPDDRYADGDALADDLERFLQGQPVLASPDPRWPRAAWFVAGLLLLSGLSAASYLALRGGTVPPVSPPSTSPPDERATEGDRARATEHLRRATIDLAFLARAAHPYAPPLPSGGLAPAKRRARAEQALRAGLRLARGEPELTRRIEATLARLRAPPAPSRVVPVSGARRRAARTRFHEVRRLELERRAKADDLDDAYGEVLALDPLHWEARFRRGRLRFVARGRVEGIREAIDAVRWRPAFLGDLWDTMCGVVKVGRATRTRLESVVIRLDLRTSAIDRVTAGLFGGLLLLSQEWTDATAALAGLDAVLAEEPADAAARSLRGFLLLRANRLADAQRDLDWVWEAHPDCSFTAFSQALLAGRKRAPAAEVRAWLSRVRSLGQVFWKSDGWMPEAYPGLRAYRSLPGFEALRPVR